MDVLSIFTHKYSNKENEPDKKLPFYFTDYDILNIYS